MSFTAFNLHPDLVRAVDALGFTTATPVQAKAIPPACAGRDLLACAMTGSGKTAAFLLPILQQFLGKPRGVTRALVLAPTRELAAQIDEHRRELGRFTRLSGAAVFGGVGMAPQEHAFRRGVDILVATPGPPARPHPAPYARLDGIEVLVLDEADRMLDMGFLPDVRRILRALPAEAGRRCSSRRRCRRPSRRSPASMLHDPALIDVERPSAPASGVTHAAYAMPRS